MAFFGKKIDTDEELVRACARNDRRAQEALYRRFFPGMLQMCRRYTRDEQAALEVLNIGFLRVFQKIDRFAFKGSLEGWIRRIVYHAIADHFRNNARYLHFLVLDEQDDSIAEQGHDRLFEEDILRLIHQLPPASQAVFRLYAIEGYSHAEIADTLGMSEGTSKWHLSTARQRLRAQLNNQLTEKIRS